MPRTQPNRKRRCSYSKAALKQSFLGIKTAASPINTGAASYNICSKKLKSSRLSKVRITKNGEAAIVKYLTNALGQRVFKGELRAERPPALPVLSAQALSVLAWLKTNFPRLYAQAQARLQAQVQAQIQAQLQAQASLGSAYMYADGQLPSWAVLGEYDNGSASGAGRTEYIWLPTEDGGAAPVGLLRNSKFFAIHSDHLGTPRLMTDSLNKPVWQWPYSAFGNNKPTGILKPTTSATGAFANQPVLLATQAPASVLDLRFPGQMADDETGLFYNYFRSYDSKTGRYTQSDPVGMDGGWNRFGYVDGNPVSYSDPEGLQKRPGGGPIVPMFPRIGPTLPPANPQVGTTRNPIEVRPGTNSPGSFGGVPFSGHALDRTQGRGIPPSVVIDTVLTGRPSPGSRPNTTQYYDPVNNVTVVTNSTTGNVITIRNGPPSNSCIP